MLFYLHIQYLNIGKSETKNLEVHALDQSKNVKITNSSSLSILVLQFWIFIIKNMQ